MQARIDAVHTLAANGGLPARAILAGLHDQPVAVQQAVAQALSSIDMRLRLWSIAQDLFYGLSLGSVLLLAAMGLAITFGVMGVINMAHGEVMMIGAYTTYLVQQAIGAAAPALAPISILIAIPAAFWSAAASASPSNAGSSASCMAGRWKPCSPPGACRWCCSRRSDRCSARPTSPS